MSPQTASASAIFNVLTEAKNYLATETFLWVNGFMDFDYKNIYILHNFLPLQEEEFYK